MNNLTIILVYRGTLEVPRSPWSYVPNWYIPEPNNYIYIFGLLVGLLVQFLITYDLFYTYLECSQFFKFQNEVRISDKALKLITFFKLDKITNETMHKYYWRTSLLLFFTEILYSLISYNLFCFHFLTISLNIWTISFICSLFQLTVSKKFLDKSSSFLIMQEKFNKLILSLEQEIENLSSQWKHELQKEFKENYDESLLNEKTINYREMKTKALYETVFSEHPNLLEDLTIDPDEELEMFDDYTIMDRLLLPARMHYIYVFFYSYYIAVCCKDSPYLYERIWPILFGYPEKGQYIFKTITLLENSQKENYYYNFFIEYGHYFYF